MALLGGKGTLWGPVIGAPLFHVVKEVTWTYLLGWQWVALGVLIVINVVFFQQGIMGWLQRKWPERFGITVDSQMAAADERGAGKMSRVRMNANGAMIDVSGRVQVLRRRQGQHGRLHTRCRRARSPA